MKRYFFSTSFLILLIGITIIWTGGFSGYYGTSIQFEDKKYFLGIPFIFISLVVAYFELCKKRKSSIEYSKCPKCKETFAYSELDNGICPKCDIKTIDIEKYYNKDINNE